MNPEALGEPLADLAARRPSGSRLRWLNALPAERAEAELLACCGSKEWAARVAARRPFADTAALAGTADQVWEGLGPDGWLEAFAAHPRIGDRSGGAEPADASGGAPGASERAGGAEWSRAEQAGVADADPGVLAALAEGNLAYKRRFGHVFLIFASGRKADELLAALHQRLRNDPETELRMAAAEQRKITQLRLSKLMRP
jgi:OHCU decarboxylase